MKSSPLGKYATVVAAFVIVFVIVTAVLQHMFTSMWGGETDTLIDAMALVAFGIVTGTGASLMTLNGTVAKVDEHAADIDTLKSMVLTNTGKLNTLIEKQGK